MNLTDCIDPFTEIMSIQRQDEEMNNEVNPEKPDILGASTSDTDQFAPIRMRKTGLWSEEALKPIKGKSGSNIIELERFQNEKAAELEDDIPVIPDMDDLQDDPLNLPDVKPIVSIDKLTYKELDSQLENFQIEKGNFGDLGDIDLSFLTNKLYPEKDIQISNEVWTMETLCNDLLKSHT